MYSGQCDSCRDEVLEGLQNAVNTPLTAPRQRPARLAARPEMTEINRSTGLSGRDRDDTGPHEKSGWDQGEGSQRGGNQGKGKGKEPDRGPSGGGKSGEGGASSSKT